MQRPSAVFLEERTLHQSGYAGAARDCAKAYSRLRAILGENFDRDGGRERAGAVIQRLDGAAISRCQRPAAIIVRLSPEQHLDRAIQRFAVIIEIQKGERAEGRLEIVAPGAVAVLK